MVGPGRGGPGTVIAAAVAAVTTITLLRGQAAVRARGLQALVGEGKAQWAALARIMAGGRFLDPGRSRRGGGPRGTLTVVNDHLVWTPDRHESRHRCCIGCCAAYLAGAPAVFVLRRIPTGLAVWRSGGLAAWRSGQYGNTWGFWRHLFAGPAGCPGALAALGGDHHR